MSDKHNECGVTEHCGLVLCPARKASALRATQTQDSEWGQLVVRNEPGGQRHFLDGIAVHCGYGLRLQRSEVRDDDYGEYTVLHDEGVWVRYEASWGRDGLRATLHANVAGAEFVASHEPWHRFRWPA